MRLEKTELSLFLCILDEGFGETVATNIPHRKKHLRSRPWAQLTLGVWLHRIGCHHKASIQHARARSLLVSVMSFASEAAFLRGTKDHINRGSYSQVLRPKTRAIPETTVCRILVFRWSWSSGPILEVPADSANVRVHRPSRARRGPRSFRPLPRPDTHHRNLSQITYLYTYIYINLYTQCIYIYMHTLDVRLCEVWAHIYIYIYIYIDFTIHVWPGATHLLQ